MITLLPRRLLQVLIKQKEEELGTILILQLANTSLHQVFFLTTINDYCTFEYEGLRKMIC